MRYAQAVRFISLPVAAGLAVALVVACTDNSLTAPQKFDPSAPAFAYSYTDDVNGDCPHGYKPISVTPGSLGDLDSDGLVCRKGGAGGGKKKPPKK